MLQCLEIVLLHFFQTAVGVGICLEISQIGIGVAITSPVEFQAFVDLGENVLGCAAVGRVEGGVVAKGASATGDCAVPVGAGVSGIDYHFLQPGAVFEAQVVHIGVVATPSGEDRTEVSCICHLLFHITANLHIFIHPGPLFPYFSYLWRL